MLDASFEEKSAWIQLAALVVGLGAYFVFAGMMLARGELALPAYAPLFTAATVFMVILLVVGHAAAALTRKPEPADERDRLIVWKSEARSSWLLGTGIITGITGLLFSMPTVWVAHVLLGSMFLGEVLSLTLRLKYYRRGL